MRILKMRRDEKCIRDRRESLSVIRVAKFSGQNLETYSTRFSVTSWRSSAGSVVEWSARSVGDRLLT